MALLGRGLLFLLERRYPTTVDEFRLGRPADWDRWIDEPTTYVHRKFRASFFALGCDGIAGRATISGGLIGSPKARDDRNGSFADIRLMRPTG